MDNPTNTTPSPTQSPVQSTTSSNSSRATASLVLGILGLVFWFIPILGAPAIIIGLVLGIKGLKTTKHGKATAGVILSIIGLVLTIINSVAGAYLGATGRHPLVNKILGKNPTVNIVDVLGASSTAAVPAGWKSYSSSNYGLSFIYPNDWQVVEDSSKNSVILTSIQRTGAKNVKGTDIPYEKITFTVADKNYFNPPVITKYGSISFDPKTETIFDVSNSEGPVCMASGALFRVKGAVSGVAYAGNLMSTPNYGSYVVLVQSDKFILITEEMERGTDDKMNQLVSEQFTKFVQSIVISGHKQLSPTCTSRTH